MTESADIVYRINDQDQIIYVNEVWDRFARANLGEAVCSEQVLNRPLWDFISDTPTRELYREALARIRSGRALRFSFRCDGPMCRRFLEMQITAAGEGIVEFRTVTLKVEPREEAPTLLAALRERSHEVLRVCGWCKKVDAGGEWVEIEEAVDRLGLFERPHLPSLTHGICEGCHRQMAQLIAAG